MGVGQRLDLRRLCLGERRVAAAPLFWKGWALYAALRSRTAVTTSSKLVKARLRSWAIAHVAASRTVPSADAFCFGFLTWAGMMAVMQCSPSASYASSSAISPSRGCSTTPVLRLSQTVLSGTPPQNSYMWTWQRSHARSPMSSVGSK